MRKRLSESDKRDTAPMRHAKSPFYDRDEARGVEIEAIAVIDG
jgi:hypothetical protein